MAKTETGEDPRRKLHAAILVVVKDDGKLSKNSGTRVAMVRDSFARPRLKEDGNHPTQTTGGVLCLPARHVLLHVVLNLS